MEVDKYYLKTQKKAKYPDNWFQSGEVFPHFNNVFGKEWNNNKFQWPWGGILVSELETLENYICNFQPTPFW